MLLADLSPDVIVLLVMVAAFAGWVDAVAGGGGLLVLPVLLWAGLLPVQALATNKLQGSFGTLTATYRFMRMGVLHLRPLWLPVGLTALGAMLGTLAVQHVASQFLEQVIPVLLIAFAVYFLFSPRVGDADAQQRVSMLGFASTAALLIGFYDGFFGPGTGSFFAMAFVWLLGYNLRRATAGTKLLNFTSNLVSLAVFAGGGQVLWSLGLMMGLAQILGAWLGAQMALRHGSALIRPLLVVVSLGISLRLLWPD